MSEVVLLISGAIVATASVLASGWGLGTLYYELCCAKSRITAVGEAEA